MGRRRNSDGIDIEVEQLLDVGNGGAAERARNEIGLLEVGIGDPDELRARQPREHPGMIATHHADADHADTQRRLRTRLYRLHHILTDFPLARPSAKPSPSTLSAGWRPPRKSTANTI